MFSTHLLHPASSLSRAADLAVSGASTAADYVTSGVSALLDLADVFIQVLNAILQFFVTAVFDIIGMLTLFSVQHFLYIENPRNIDALNNFWVDSLVVSTFIVFATVITYLGFQMLLADTEEADIQRIVHRLLISTIFLAISREFFGVFVELTNLLTYGILPDGYSFYIANGLINAGTSFVGSLFAAFIVTFFVGLQAIVAFVGLFIVLAMRMMIIYFVYASLPVIHAFWVVDIGPGRYGKMFADFTLKIAGVMMVLGLVIAAILAVGAGFGGSENLSNQEGVEMASGSAVQDDGSVTFSVSDYGPRTVTPGESGGEFSNETASEIMLSLFGFFGSIWLVMSIFVLLSMKLISATKPPSTSPYQRNKDNSPTPNAPAAPSKTPGPGPEGGIWAAQGDSGSAGTATSYELDNGKVAVVNPSGDGVLINPEARDNPGKKQFERFTADENPLASTDAPANPFNSTYQRPSAKENIKDKLGIDDGNSPLASKLSEMAPDKAKQAGSFLKKGGGAWWNVQKQPTIEESVNAAADMYENSKYAPSKGSDEPVTETGLDAYDLGRDAVIVSGHGEVNDGGDDEREVVDLEAGQDTEPEQPDWSEAFIGRGPEPVLSKAEDEYNPSPLITGFKGAQTNVIYQQTVDRSVNDLHIDSYDSATVGLVRDNVKESSKVLSKFGIDHNSQPSPEVIQSMLDHQQLMGLPADIAVQRTTETVLNKAADPLNETYIDPGTYEQFGIEDVPEELATDAPARRINLGKEGTGGFHGDNMWRVERNDGSIVYEKNVSETGVSGSEAIVTESVMSELGVSTPSHHHDPITDVVRSEGINGASLQEIIDGDTSIDASNIDREEFIDAYAAMGLSGHGHAVNKNVLIKEEDNSVVPIDYDSGGAPASNDKPNALEQGAEAADSLGLSVTEEDIAERMQDKAQEYVKNNDSTSDLVEDRLPDPDSESIEDISKGDGVSDTDSTEEAIRRKAENDRLNGLQKADAIHQGIEDVANGDALWQDESTNHVFDDDTNQSDKTGSSSDTDEDTVTVEDVNELIDSVLNDMDHL